MNCVHALFVAMDKETGEVFESERFIEYGPEEDIQDAISGEREDWWPCMDFIWATFIINQSFTVEMARINFAKYANAWLENNNQRGAA